MFAVFVILAVVLLFLPNAYREELARGVRATLLRPVLALQQGAIERHSAFEDPSRLRAQRDSLAAFLVGQATLAAENRQLRALLGIQERLPPSFVPAEVVRIPGRGSEGFFQLTAGTEHGVAAGSPIVSAEGLVGRVREADATVSFGIDWMHPEFRASAMTVDGDVYGIVEPRRVGGEALLALTGTPRHVELETDALIVTSGHGGVFPRGIPVGVVIGPEGGEEGWQRNYLVRPLVAPTEMTYVLVLGEPQRSLEGRDLALSWGIRPVDPIPEVEREFEAAVAAADAAAAGEPMTPPPAQPAQPQPSPPGLLGVPVEP